MNRTGDHVDEMTCLLYLDGQLEAGAARQLVAHTEACPECLRLLGTLERETHLLHESLVEDDEAIPEHLLDAPPIENISWGRIGALGLAAAGVYGIWSAVAQPWLDQFRQVGLGQENLLTMLFFSGVFWKGWKEMPNVFELLSLVSIATIVVLLLARNVRRLISLPVVLTAVVVAALGLPAPAAATEFYHSKTESYTLSPDSTVHTDLVVGAPSAHIDGTVEGDLVVFAGSIVVGGHVTGDLIAWAQDIRIDGKVDGSCICGAQRLHINGQVGGSVRTFVQSVLVEGEVSRNLMAWAQKVEISRKGRVSGSLLAMAETIASDGRIEHDLNAGCDETDLNGYVGGNTALRSNHLTIGPQAEIRGTASNTGEHSPEISPRAKLSSPLAFEMVSRWEEYRHLHYYWVHLVLLSAACLVGLVFLFLLPGFFSGAVRKCAKFGASTGFGALVMIATPILALLACFTLVGIPLSITAIFAYVVALYSAQIVVGTWLGEKLLGAAMSRGAQIGRMALGLVLLRICFTIPYVKAVAWGVVVPMGLGAMVLAAYDQIRAAQISSSAA